MFFCQVVKLSYCESKPLILLIIENICFSLIEPETNERFGKKHETNPYTESET